MLSHEIIKPKEYKKTKPIKQRQIGSASYVATNRNAIFTDGNHPDMMLVKVVAMMAAEKFKTPYQMGYHREFPNKKVIASNLLYFLPWAEERYKELKPEVSTPFDEIIKGRVHRAFHNKNGDPISKEHYTRSQDLKPFGALASQIVESGESWSRAKILEKLHV